MKNIVDVVRGKHGEFLGDEVTKLQTYQKPTDGFILGVANHFQSSDEYKNMLKAEQYDRVRNTEIDNRSRYYLDADGLRQTDINVSNNKIKHAKFPILVDQKVSYLLSKPFTVQAREKESILTKQLNAEKRSEGDLRVKSASTINNNDPVRIDYEGNNEEVVSMLSGLYSAKFRQFLRRVVRESVVKGISWVQMYYQGNELKYKRIPSEQVIPFWVDADHTELEGVLRAYDITEYSPSGERINVTKFEWHTPNGSWYYRKDDKSGRLVTDETIVIGNAQPIDGQHGHFAVENTTTGEQSYAVWGRVPFIPFKYNGNELGLLDKVKALIDEYDKSRSDWANLIEDIPNAVKVVRGYDGEDPVEFLRNLNYFKVAFVDEDGGMETQESALSVEALKQHAEQLQRDIFESGSGVDLQNENLGSASGVALKYRYSGLDIDCRELGNEINASLQQLSWFFKKDLVFKGLSGEEVLDLLEEYIFNTDIIINETEAITNAKASLGVISKETIVGNHPWVSDLEDELLRMEAEKTKEFERAQEELKTQLGNEEQFGFGVQGGKPQGE